MLKKNIVLILLTGLILTSCEDDEPATPPPTPPPTLLLSSSFSSITVGDSKALSIELADMETSVFGVSMLISYNTTVVEVDTNNSFEQGAYFGTNAIYLFERVEDEIHFSITEVWGDDMVSGTGKLCDFEVKGLTPGTSIFTIIPDEIYFIDTNGEEVVITDLEVGDLTITVSD